jgi:two-component system sensor histidine kinase DegS
LVQSKNRRIQRNPHLWIIVALMAILTISYYADELGVDWLPLGHRFFDEEYIHDIHRLLFLIPMVYCAIVFRLKGAIVISVATLCIVFPRALFFSPNPDPVLRTLIFSGIASTATISLGLERDRRLRERKAHQDLENTGRLLTASEARYRDLFNSASDAIYIRDLKGNILEANRAMSDMTGYTIDELINMNISQIYTSESYKTTIERQERQLDGEVGSERYELMLMKKDGTTTIIDVMISILYKNTQPVAVQASMRDVTEQKQLRDNLQYYIVEITKAQEEERKRIARELHDDTAQDLATLLLDFDAIIESKEKLPEATLQKVDRLRERAETIMEGVRRFSHELRPAILDQLGLLPALQWLADDINVSYGIDASMIVKGNRRRFSPEVELELFRVAQEAFSNVRKHAQASKMDLIVEFGEGKTTVTIYDNGKGFDAGDNLANLPRTGKLGLAGMEERVRLLGGTLRIQSELGKGTTITVVIPQ